MLKPLLTPDHVADILHLSRRKVLELPVPKIRIGDGRGKILFKEEDVLDYLRSRTEYPEQKGANHVSGVSKKPKNGVTGSSFTVALGSDTRGTHTRKPRTRRRRPALSY